MVKVFVTGATGYIGGSVFSQLVNSFKQKKIEATFQLLVRTEAKAAKIQEWSNQRQLTNVSTVIGTLDDFEVVSQAAAAADIIIDAADCDSVPGIKAILAGIEKRISREQNTVPLLIHTSGTGLLVDGTQGLVEGTKIYHDDVDAEINSIADTAPHRNVDLLINEFQASHQNKADTIIIAPPTIWGLGFGPDLYLSNQLPFLIRTALTHNQAYHPGKGLHIWNQINIIDLSNVYELLLFKSLEKPGEYTGFYFAEGGEYQWKNLSKQVQKGLQLLARSVESDSKDVSQSDHAAIFGGRRGGGGGNSRSRAVKARGLGWKPQVSTTEEFFEYAISETILIAKVEGL